MGFFQKIFGGGGQGGGRLMQVAQALKSDLNLNGDQVNQLKNAVMQFKEQRRSIKESGGDKSRIAQARDALKNQILGLLNDQQKQTFMANISKYDSLIHSGDE